VIFLGDFLGDTDLVNGLEAADGVLLGLETAGIEIGILHK
jgi:hypothetical protein